MVIAAAGLYAWVVGSLARLAIIGLLSGHVVFTLTAAVATLAAAPVLLSLLPSLVHPWRHKGPVLTLDADGVTDVRKRHTFIPWSDIGQIYLGAGNTASFLCFEFRSPDRQRRDLPLLGPIGVVLNRFQALGDWNVTLRLLACRKREVLAAAQRLHKQSIRQQIVERNKGSGWSGTL